MSATYQGSMKLLEPIEGGYTPAFDNAGETYRGIDRKQNPAWRGWALIDAYKRKYGPIKKYSFLIDPAINAAVDNFYSKYWINYGMNNFTNPLLAAMVWALIVHRAANGVKQVNLHAAQYGATKFLPGKISANAAAAIEKHLPVSYATFRQRLVKYYQGFADPKKQSYINNRVLIFPENLPGSIAVQNQNASNSLQNLGLIISAFKLFF